MGCDIHFYAETKDEAGNWQALGTWRKEYDDETVDDVPYKDRLTESAITAFSPSLPTCATATDLPGLIPATATSRFLSRKARRTIVALK